MTTKQISPEGSSALLVIDVQRVLFEQGAPIYKADQLLQNINFLISKARKEDAPVIFIQHSNDYGMRWGTEEWRLHPQIQPIGEEVIIHKRFGNAFEETELKAELKKRNASTVVLTGLVTHGCVKATCLGALKEGYKVILVSDGHSNYSEDAPRIIEKWNRELGSKGAIVTDTKSVKF